MALFVSCYIPAFRHTKTEIAAWEATGANEFDGTEFTQTVNSHVVNSWHCKWIEEPRRLILGFRGTKTPLTLV